MCVFAGLPLCLFIHQRPRISALHCYNTCHTVGIEHNLLLPFCTIHRKGYVVRRCVYTWSSFLDHDLAAVIHYKVRSVRMQCIVTDIW